MVNGVKFEITLTSHLLVRMECDSILVCPSPWATRTCGRVTIPQDGLEASPHILAPAGLPGSKVETRGRGAVAQTREPGSKTLKNKYFG